MPKHISLKKNKSILSEVKFAVKKQWDLQVLLIPALLVMLVFSYFPMYGVIIAFKDYNFMDGILGSPWVGLKHFKYIFTDPFMVRSIKNSVGLSLIRLFVCFPLPIILAIMLSEVRNSGLKRVFQTISYFPFFVSWVVVCSMVQMWLSPSIGWVNAFLQAFGIIKEPIAFLAEENMFWGITIVLEIWKGIGFSTIIFLAALAGVEQEQFEAASIDGATKMQKIRYITIPAIKGTVSLLFILSISGIIGGNFDVSYLLGSDLNIEKSMILQTYTYQVGMQNARYSYSTAVGLITSIISMILLIGGNSVIKKITKSGLF